jgi:hypothetical protein
MEEFKNNKIKVINTNGEELDLTISWESDIYEWARLFRVILNWLQFHPENIKEILPENNEE